MAPLKLETAIRALRGSSFDITFSSPSYFSRSALATPKEVDGTIGICPSALLPVCPARLPARRRSVEHGLIRSQPQCQQTHRNRYEDDQTIAPIRAEVDVTPDLGRSRSSVPPVGRPQEGMSVNCGRSSGFSQPRRRLVNISSFGAKLPGLSRLPICTKTTPGKPSRFRVYSRAPQFGQNTRSSRFPESAM